MSLTAEIQTVSSPFLFLALDLPATPLFQDANEKKIIPQVPLSTILAKFDGMTTQVGLAAMKSSSANVPRSLARRSSAII